MADSPGLAAAPAEILHLVRGQAPRRLAQLDHLPEEGFVWIDFVREDAQGWEAWPRRLLNVEMDRRHVADSLDPNHKSFFDVTPDYDLIVFEGLGPSDDAFPFETRSVSLFVFERLLLTVRAGDAPSIALLKQRFADGRVRAPGNPRVLAQIVLDIMVSRFLGLRDHLGARMNAMQQELLDPKSPFNDWQQLLLGRREAQRLEGVCDEQIEALDNWHRDSSREWPNPEETRLRDLSEHITRVLRAAADLERHIEAAVQLYFASTAHRTNEVMRMLTVFSAIFLPLTFVAGVYGMNFQYMPELHTVLGYPFVLVVMVSMAGGLLFFFRRRGYF